MINMKTLLNIVTIFLTVFEMIRGEHRDLALDGVQLRLEKVLCFCNPKYCTINICNVKFKSRQVANLNWVATLNRNLSIVHFNVKMFYKFSNNEYRPILIDVTADHCDDQPGSSSSTFVTLLKTGEYYLKDWNFSASDLPSVIPAGRYLVKAFYRTNFDDLFLNASLYFNVDNHGILDLNMG